MYCNQAEKQLSSSWVLMRAGNLGVPSTIEWLTDVLPSGGRVGIDPVSNTLLVIRVRTHCSFFFSFFHSIEHN